MFLETANSRRMKRFLIHSLLSMINNCDSKGGPNINFLTCGCLDFHVPLPLLRPVFENASE